MTNNWQNYPIPQNHYTGANYAILSSFDIYIQLNLCNKCLFYDWMHYLFPFKLGIVNTGLRKMELRLFSLVFSVCAQSIRTSPGSLKS